ncbi:MAG TPA: 2'-5' RNA ligase family protein [Thermoanaerobaculia bacterium]|nr:2'-5' RNA ligase family protein [Thermoanaerobaculia bacterium]
MRAFLAVVVEGEETVSRLRALIARLREIRGLRTVPPHQLHFTLRFFEDLPEAQLAGAKAAAARATTSSTASAVMRGTSATASSVAGLTTVNVCIYSLSKPR